MDTTLLATKLRIPLQPHHVVQRTRLSSVLEQSIPLYKLLLVSAPAGYGKTTMLAEWARSSRLPIVWLSLGDDDNDVERFLRYLLEGWEQVQPGMWESPVGLLLSSMMPDREAVLVAFINAAAEAPGDLVFILDDYHLIEDSSIHQALAFLLDNLPPTIHFLLASRAEPPLPLARYRARHQLLEFRADDLQFSLGETADFLNSLMRLSYTHDEVAVLQAQVEGWVAGLQLAAVGVVRVPRTAGIRDGFPVLEGGRVLDVANVIWCTGYHPSFSWINLPVLGEHEPLHERGIVTSEPGLYFVGLKFLYAASSTMIHGVSRDAERIVKAIAARTSGACMLVGV